MKLLISLSISFCVLLLVSCFPAASGTDWVGEEGEHLITFHIDRVGLSFLSRANGAGSVTRVDLAVFDSTDTRIARINQLLTDADFLSPSVVLPEGDYRLVIIAHSCNGAATITSPSEVTFPQNKVTDTFTSFSHLTVTPQTPLTSQVSLTLMRAVSMMRLVMTDAQLPSAFSQLQFYYTGGSSTYSPLASCGSKNSRQTEVRLLSDADLDTDGHPVFEVFTFPHQPVDEVKLTLTPQDDQGKSIAPERVINAIPIRLNTVTEIRGPLFVPTTTASFQITICDQWSDTIHYQL